MKILINLSAVKNKSSFTESSFFSHVNLLKKSFSTMILRAVVASLQRHSAA